MRRVLVLLFTAFLGRSAAAGRLVGVALPDSITVEGTTLVLNGMGIRKATIFRVKAYVAGLYLENKSSSADEIIRSEQVASTWCCCVLSIATTSSIWFGRDPADDDLKDALVGK